MLSQNEIRRHISAIEETRKITNAMQLVSTSRLKRVMTHIEYNHRYFMRVQAAMNSILAMSGGVKHPYLDGREGRRRTYIVVAGDKGMAGAYNSNVLELALKRLEEDGAEVSLITVGLVASEFFHSRGIMPDVEVTGTIQDPTLDRARELALDVFSLYDQNLTDEVYIIYTSFYGESKNKPEIKKLLPVAITGDEVEEGDWHNMIYEPSAEEVFSHLVPQYVIGILFGALVQAYACEHYARMNAMRSATHNADEMMRKLTMQYNLARQSAITQEISEIAGAAEALGGQDNG